MTTMLSLDTALARGYAITSTPDDAMTFATETLRTQANALLDRIQEAELNARNFSIVVTLAQWEDLYRAACAINRNLTATAHLRRCAIDWLTHLWPDVAMVHGPQASDR